MSYAKIAFNILIVMLITSACSSSPRYVPVSDSHSFTGEAPRYHTVKKGETLYSIAWRYGLNFRELARSNGISAGYRIYPGQKISLKYTKQVKTLSDIKKRNVKTVGKSTVSTASHAKRSINKTSNFLEKTVEKLTSSPKKWIWPANGKVTNTFGAKKTLHKGVDIRGVLGDSVNAAAAGKVVYSGEGLRGYGKLIILKHSEKYLSAYAHNKQLLVREGEDVKQGQKIAAMGSSGTDKVKLHFQIRFDGKPVNPLKYLPKK